MTLSWTELIMFPVDLVKTFRITTAVISGLLRALKRTIRVHRVTVPNLVA